MNLLISFSGGETSAMMTYQLIQAYNMDGISGIFPYDKVVIVFANTGEENEQTLRFVQQCDEKWGWDVRWVEAVVHHGQRIGTTHRLVTFGTASRYGQPYEEVIKKYGIPNQSFPHCTRELKTAPIYSYMDSIGWKRGAYEVAIGIRADEASRKDKQAKEKGYVYPLCDWNPVTKQDVNTFWYKQPFRLKLTGYQGNCKWCWKKTTRKLLTIMDETPQAFDFPERMEQTYSMVGPEFAKGTAPGYKRTFFRKHLSVQDLRTLHQQGDWQKADDDSIVYNHTLIPMDEEHGCIESCDAFASEESPHDNHSDEHPVPMVDRT